MAVQAELLTRAGDLKGRLVAFSQQPCFEAAADEFLGEYGDGPEPLDEDRLTLLWDSFVLEHRLPDGRTMVEHFVAAHPELPEAEREMVLGWQDVVQGPFEVRRRDGAALVVEGLVDDLTYRVRSNMGPAVFRRMPRASFIIARLVPIGDEWMLSGPTHLLPAAQRDIAYQLALDMALRTPDAVFRNPERLALAWDQQRADRERFIRFFGADQVVLPGAQSEERLNAYYAFCREQLAGPSEGLAVELPLDMVESETVALIYDETDGLGFYAEFALVEEAFAQPALLRRRRWREHVLDYLHDESVEPMVLRRLADRDPEAAGVVIRRLLKRPRFDWARDGDALMRELKPGYFARPPRPRISPVSDRLAAFIARRRATPSSGKR